MPNGTVSGCVLQAHGCSEYTSFSPQETAQYLQLLLIIEGHRDKVFGFARLRHLQSFWTVFVSNAASEVVSLLALALLEFEAFVWPSIPLSTQ